MWLIDPCEDGLIAGILVQCGLCTPNCMRKGTTLYCLLPKLNEQVVVPEWLSGMTRNHVGFARAGSNPADHIFIFTFFVVEEILTLQELFGLNGLDLESHHQE